MNPIRFGWILVMVAICYLRLTGIKDDIFKDTAHFCVAFWICAAVDRAYYQDKINEKKPWLFYVVISSIAIVVEVFKALRDRHFI